MEALYKKLYEKYTKLKTEKFSDLEQINKDQEVKFVKCVSAAEELIEHLTNEMNRLKAQVNDLRSEVASIRSMKDGQYAEYQKLLMDENEKNKVLSEEIERLRNLQQEGLCCSSKDDKNEKGQLNMPGGAEVGSADVSSRTSRKMRRKRGRSSVAEAEGVITPCTTNQVDRVMVREPANDLSKDTDFSAAQDIQQPECCRRTTYSSDGGGRNNAGPTNCPFKALVESLLGMEFSTVNQTEGIRISALHQSSGYSFSLTWINKATGEEAELLYCVSSLGTFERIAPEWMREVLMFSTSMCPIFFERVSRVIKLQH